MLKCKNSDQLRLLSTNWKASALYSMATSKVDIARIERKKKLAYFWLDAESFSRENLIRLSELLAEYELIKYKCTRHSLIIEVIN